MRGRYWPFRVGSFAVMWFLAGKTLPLSLSYYFISFTYDNRKNNRILLSHTRAILHSFDITDTSFPPEETSL